MIARTCRAERTGRVVRPRALLLLALLLGPAWVGQASGSHYRTRPRFEAARARVRFQPHSFQAAAYPFLNATRPNAGALALGGPAAVLGGASGSMRLGGYTLAELLMRRTLNPARFDRYHPRLGPLLACWTNPCFACPVAPPICSPCPPTTPVLTVVPTIEPQGTIPGPPSPPETPIPQTIPEPSALLIGMTLVAGSALLRRRSPG